MLNEFSQDSNYKLINYLCNGFLNKHGGSEQTSLSLKDMFLIKTGCVLIQISLGFSSYLPYVNISLGNGLMPNMWQAITQTNFDEDHLHIIAPQEDIDLITILSTSETVHFIIVNLGNGLSLI